MTAVPKTKRKKAPRKQLSKERIISAALELADKTEGDFSMRALGQKLGVDPMAIYRHFRDKDAVLDAIVEAALARLTPLTSETGTPRDRLRQMCLDLREVLLDHPGVALRMWMTIPKQNSHTLVLMENTLATLREMGLDAAEAMHAFISTIQFVSGVTAAEERLRIDAETEEAWYLEAGELYSSISADDFPNVVAMVDETMEGGVGLVADFEFGLDLLLEGLERRATQKKRKPRKAPAKKPAAKAAR